MKSTLKLDYICLFVLKLQHINGPEALNYPLLHVLTLSHNLKSLLSVCMREEMSFLPLFLPLFLIPTPSPLHPPSTLPTVIYAADEAEPNVYDRRDGGGK